MFNNRCAYQNWLARGIFLYCISAATVCQAQITPDGTLPTQIITSDNIEFIINGGSKAGGNLFHSFSEFSIPTGGSATFNHADNIQNIISRVTGGSPSSIDGLIKAGSNANLFLINSNGIIFGSQARLEIGGSFLASTADRIQFADGSSFIANSSPTTPLLTVSAPIGLQYRENTLRTSDRSIVVNGNFDSYGLQVQGGKTLALVGKDIFVPGGILIAPEGRVELGSVSDNSFVSLTPVDNDSIDKGWILGYEGVQNFRDIQLSDGAFVASYNLSNPGSSGDIQLQSRRLTIASGANVLGVNNGVKPGGTITIKAAEFIEVSGETSTIASYIFSDAKGGDIAIETKQLFIREGGTIQSFVEEGAGEGGNLTIVASESIELTGGSNSPSILTTRTNSTGNAGTLQITTSKLTLNQGGQISTSTFGAGTGGTLIVDATESIEVSGQSLDGSNDSALFSQSVGETATGNGGNLQVKTGLLVIRDGGRVSVSAIDGSTGKGGNLSITASQLVEVAGIGTNAEGQVQPSTLASISQGSGDAGNVTIQTNRLNVRNGAEVNVSSENTGNAGNLEINASTISLNNEGKLIANSKAGRSGGNIILQDLESLKLGDNSVISTNAGGEGNGGNITIVTDLLTALGNSSITAQAEGAGDGGNIRIKTQGFFVSPDSEISATSQKGVDGVVEIDRLENDPENALLTLPAEPVNISGLIAQGCSSGAGSIARRSSEFVITGRGGLPPTPKEASRSDFAVADLGKPVEAEATQAKVVAPTNQKHLESTPLVEAQGWVIGSKGEVILTASVPNVTPSIPWMKSNSCHG